MEFLIKKWNVQLVSTLVLALGVAMPGHATPLGLAPSTPGISAAHILSQNPAAADGLYWVDPDGDGGAAAVAAAADMSTDGGGWTAYFDSTMTIANLSAQSSVQAAAMAGLANADVNYLFKNSAGTALGILLSDNLPVYDSNSWVNGLSGVIDTQHSLAYVLFKTQNSAITFNSFPTILANVSTYTLRDLISANSISSRAFANQSVWARENVAYAPPQQSTSPASTGTSANSVPVPEPGTLLLLSLGIAGFNMARQTKQK